MSKKKLLKPVALARADQQDYQASLDQVRAVRALQHKYAAAIIGAGLFSNGELWSGIVCALAEHEAARRPIDESADAQMTHAIAWGDTGFLLGLAVGMQLGPHAFDDGGAK